MAKIGLALLLSVPWFLGHVTFTKTSALCKGGIEGPGVAATICETPYCTCNDPYGKIYCSCRALNSSYPEVAELTIRSSGPCSVNQEAQDLIIADCANVTFPENELSFLRSLRSVQVNNVREINIQKRGFHWNATNVGLRIRLTDTTIADLPSYAFSGQIQHVVLRGVYLGLIHAFAFSNIADTDRLQFVNCNFANIEPQSFKKFATNEFLIENSRFNVIPSRFLIEIHVHKLFRLDSNSIENVRTLAFQVLHPVDMSVTNNRIESIEGEAFKVQVHGRVTFQDNIFSQISDGAFRGITFDRRHQSLTPAELIFENNTLGTFAENVLQFDKSFSHVRLSRLLIEDTCTCENLISWKDVLHPNLKKDRGPVERHLSELWCQKESKKETDFEFISGELFYQDHCTTFITSIYFFVIIIVSTTVGLCIFIVICIFFIRRRRKWDTVPTSEVQGVTPKKPDQTKGLVVPDGRLYRETEFHVIVEKAEPLDEVVPYRVTRDRSKTTFTRVAPS